MNLNDAANHYDVVIVGGGPAGSTCGSLIKKYQASMKVLIVEREKFPREHVGESQLPQIGAILHEMGVWDAVERAEFPIKVGATYLWGNQNDLWDFNFVPPEQFKIEQRPAPYSGQRRATALQVDRARYDEILLKHAEGLGCEVRQETGVKTVLRDGDRVLGLDLSDGSTVTAENYVDASGNAAVIRRAMEVPIDCPTLLKNIAVWDYWSNTEWADSIGIGGTRVQVISVGFGWLWFIPMSPTRTSLGLVCPVTKYKSSGKTPEELYLDAIASSPRITELVANGKREGKVRTTNDWSYVSTRTTGENWMLVGESAGFADPILAAGLTLTHVGGREAAYSLIALHRKEFDADWLKHCYHDNQVRRVRQHMRFAEFWYASNGRFTDLQDHCKDIAKSSGLNLTAQQAWAWLAQGGFTNDVPGQAVVGGFTLASMMQVTKRFTGEDIHWNSNDYNVYRLNLEGTTSANVPVYDSGKITSVPCFFRGDNRLPMIGFYGILVEILKRVPYIDAILKNVVDLARSKGFSGDLQIFVQNTIDVLEVLVREGWVTAEFDPSRTRLRVNVPVNQDIYREHEEFRKGFKTST
jgi:flavin-dependent dehydrogenase